MSALSKYDTEVQFDFERLPGDMQLECIGKVTDLKTRCSLRFVSRAMKHAVDKVRMHVNDVQINSRAEERNSQTFWICTRDTYMEGSHVQLNDHIALNHVLRHYKIKEIQFNGLPDRFFEFLQLEFLQRAVVTSVCFTDISNRFIRLVLKNMNQMNLAHITQERFEIYRHTEEFNISVFETIDMDSIKSFTIDYDADANVVLEFMNKWRSDKGRIGQQLMFTGSSYTEEFFEEHFEKNFKDIIMACSRLNSPITEVDSYFRFSTECPDKHLFLFGVNIPEDDDDEIISKYKLIVIPRNMPSDRVPTEYGLYW